MSSTPSNSKFETRLAYSAVSVIALSLVSMMITLLLALFNVDPKPAILAQIPLIGLPLGFMIIIALLITSIIRRSRENKS